QPAVKLTICLNNSRLVGIVKLPNGIINSRSRYGWINLCQSLAQTFFQNHFCVGFSLCVRLARCNFQPVFDDITKFVKPGENCFLKYRLSQVQAHTSSPPVPSDFTTPD